MSQNNYIKYNPAEPRNNKISFSTTVNLGSGASFSSGYINCIQYSQVQTHILSDVSGTITIRFSNDSIGNDIVRTLSIPYTGGSGFQLFSAPCFSDFIQYEYLNGSTPQTDFMYETKLLKQGLTPQLLGTESFIAPSMVSTLNRSVIVAKNSKGDYQNINSDYNGDLKVTIGNNNRSAFGELNVSNLTPVVQEIFTYNINSRKLQEVVNGTGSVSQSNGTASVSSGGTASSDAMMQTRKKIRYRPGEGVLARFTASFTTGVSGVESYAGCIDTEDGFAFGYNGDTFGILHRNSANGSLVDTWISQSSWNSDVADGTSTLPLLDTTKLNVFEVQLQYLGAGAIKFYIENPAGGEFILVHTIEYANANTYSSLSNPTLPFCMYVENGGNAVDYSVCSSSVGLFIEGKDIPLGFINNIDNNKSSIGSTETNILTIQNKSTFNSKTNKNLVYPYLLNIATISFTKPVTVNVILNTTLGGTPSYTDIDTNNSITSYDTAGTTITGGSKLTSFILSKEDKISINLKEFTELFLSPGDTLTISASTTSGNGEVFTNITWLEDL